MEWKNPMSEKCVKRITFDGVEYKVCPMPPPSCRECAMKHNCASINNERESKSFMGTLCYNIIGLGTCLALKKGMRDEKEETHKQGDD